MLIPNAERALVNIRKLRDYCLNPTHPEGKHKARLFAAALGMTAYDAENLRSELLQVVKTHDAPWAGVIPMDNAISSIFCLNGRANRP